MNSDVLYVKGRYAQEYLQIKLKARLGLTSEYGSKHRASKHVLSELKTPSASGADFDVHKIPFKFIQELKSRYRELDQLSFYAFDDYSGLVERTSQLLNDINSDASLLF